MPVIVVSHLAKRYGNVPVLTDVSLQLEQGQVYGLLGTNGAGKSTLIHLLMGMLRPDSGTISLLGSHDIEAVRDQIGYLPERQRYHTAYTGREYLRFLGQMNGMRGATLDKRISEELAAVGLVDDANRRISTYSTGMLQRLGIAQALLHDPSLLLIDEPTAGLDPAGRREVVEILRESSSRGHSVLLSSHFPEEIEQLCDTVGVLFGGIIAAERMVATLRASQSVAIDVGMVPQPLVQTLLQMSSIVKYDGQFVTIQSDDPGLKKQVLQTLLDAGVQIGTMEPQRHPIEEFYLSVVRGQPPAEANVPLYNPYAPPGHKDAAPLSQPSDQFFDELLYDDDNDTTATRS